MKTSAPLEEVYRILYGDHPDPFRVLGMHPLHAGGQSSVVVRVFYPGAKEVSVVEGNGKKQKVYVLEKIHDEGFFEKEIPGRTEVFPYQLKISTEDGSTRKTHDPYSFMPTLTDFDIYLFNAGDHHRIYEKLGAHKAVVNGVEGVQFAVWAPEARGVSLIGGFNGWDRRMHCMRVLGSSGIWEIFIPGLREGELYKYQVKTQRGIVLDKTDPYAFESEVRPRTASKVNFLDGHLWNDKEWMEIRSSGNHFGKPMSIYEVHLGSWQRNDDGTWCNYKDLARKLAEYAASLGFTHLELLPVMEHPFDGSWGYQVTGYYAPTSRFGSPQDFMWFVDYLHQHNIGVILDWVPAHFPKDIHALGLFDGTHVYEHADPRKGEHQDWGTYIFNYGRHEVRNFLIGNALFWLDEYHIDGLRIDAVASMLYNDYSRKEGEWIPNQYGGRENLDAVEFLKKTNEVVHQYYPGVLMIAEESTSWPGVTAPVQDGGLGFDMKWNMGWMHDTLQYFEKDPVHRVHHHNNLTFALLYAFSERFLLPLSHDEVVHGKRALLSKMPGDNWNKFANLRLLYGLMFGFPGKKLLFMGGEFGQWTEWNFEANLDWALVGFDTHRGLQQWVMDLNKLYRSHPALYEVDFAYTGFEWIDFEDAGQSVISFERIDANGGRVVVVCNFTPVPRQSYRVGVSEGGAYLELLNSDASVYGGSNVGNHGKVHSESIPQHGRTNSLSLTLPPLSTLFLKRERHQENPRDAR